MNHKILSQSIFQKCFFFFNMSSGSEYIAIKNLGINDPREIDMAWTVFQPDSFFTGSQNVSPGSQLVQKYMAERCANVWDDFCQMYAGNQWSAGAFSDNVEKVKIGEAFINQALQEKYCTTSSRSADSYCVAKKYQIAPEISTSPSVNIYEGDCKLTCTKPIPHGDPAVHIALSQEQAHPGVHRDVLMGLCSESPLITCPQLLSYCRFNGIEREQPVITVPPRLRIETSTRFPLAVTLVIVVVIGGVLAWIFYTNSSKATKKSS